MADVPSYPQIPSTVWTGVWRILHDSPSRRLDENSLAAELGVQKTAAKQYLKELARLGLFNNDGTTTDLAKSWRADGDDPKVIDAILEFVYPQELRELAPADRLDRDKIVRWFVGQGLGGGAAQNKAATYMRIASGVTSSAVKQTEGSNGSKAKAAPTPRRTRRGAPGSVDRSSQIGSAGHNGGDSDGNHDNGGRQRGPTGRPELNVNVQIHISADSSAEQIDAIFSAMRRYFDGDIAS